MKEKFEADMKFQEDFDRRHGFFGRFLPRFYGVMILKEIGELLNLLWKIERAVSWGGEDESSALARFCPEMCEEAADVYAYILKALIELFDRKIPEIPEFRGNYRQLMFLLYEKSLDLGNMGPELLGELAGILSAISKLCGCDLHESYRRKMEYNEKRFSK